MKRKHLLLMLLLALFAPWAVNAQEVLTVHSGTTTNSYVPVYGYYADAYLKCEMVYPASDLTDMNGMEIEKMTFYANSAVAAAWTATFQVFLKEVDDATISAFSGTDDATIVYEGTLDATSSSMDIEFTESYNYGGGNLLVGVYLTETGNYKSVSWLGETVTGASVQGYSYSGLSSVSPTQRNFLPMVTFTYSGAAGACPKPTINAVIPTYHTATVNWAPTSEDQVSFDLYYSTESTNPDETTTPSYSDLTDTTTVITGLETNTRYYVWLRGNCGDLGMSRWTSAVSFMTDYCHVPTALSIEELTPFEATLSWESSSEEFNVRYRTVESYGDSFDFDDNTFQGWTSIDADGDGYGWQLGSDAYPYLAAGGSLAGTGHNSSNDLVISGSYSNAFNAALYPDNYLVSPLVELGGTLSFWACAQDASYAAEHFGVAVSTLGNTDPDDFEMVPGAAWTLTAKGTGANLNPGQTRSGNRSQGSWYQFSVDLSDYAGMEGYVAIRHFDCSDWFILDIDDITFGTDVFGDWITLENITENPVVLDVEEETTYEVHVQALCEDDEISDWSTSIYFTTPLECVEPTDLYVKEVDGFSATLDWFAYTSTFNVQYRNDVVLMEGFETNTYNNWHNFSAVDEGDNWHYPGYGVPPHTGSYFAFTDGSSAAEPETNAFLVSPMVPVEGEFSFWAYAFEFAHFGVAVAINDYYGAEDFELVDEWDLTDAYEWEEFSVDLNRFGGQPGYIAIVRFDESVTNNVLCVDDITLVGPRSQWFAFDGVEKPFTLEDLQPESMYQFMVQGNCSSGDETEWASIFFSTTGSCKAPDLSNYDYEVSELTPFSAVLEWTVEGEDEPEVIDFSYAPFSGNPENGTIVTVGEEHMVAMEDLLPSTYYYMYVRANCGMFDLSEWVYVGYLITPTACPYVTDMIVSDVASFSASVEWAAGGEETAWELVYSVGYQYPTDEDTPIMLEDPSYELTGLEPSTTYYVFVRAYCDETYQSSWKYTSFTTLSACDPIVSLTVSDITTDGATATWEAGDQETSWQVVIKTSSYTPTDEDEIITVDEPTYTFSALEGSTIYYVFVRANCDETYHSAWTYTNFTTLEACPDNMVCIGSGTSTNSYLPTYTYYNYSLTQQIYTPEEIGQAGTIESIDFYKKGTNSANRNLSIYMVSTEKVAFSGNYDWITVTSDDLVFSGNVTFADNDWTTIEFATPFEYDGTSNVALVVDDNTGSWVSSPQFYVFSASSQAIRVYSDGTNYDPYAPSYSGSVLNVKNRVRLAFTVVSSCPKPTGLAVSDITTESAKLSWTNGDEETAWQICINGDEENLLAVDSNPFTLTGLSDNTVYTAKVRAYCSATDQSDWSNTVSFTTLEICPDNMVCIGSGTSTNSYVPTYTYYNYSLTQQIYTAEEIGEAGAIGSVDFYKTGNSTSRKLNIYMVSTDSVGFSGTTAWIPVTRDDLVYSGNVYFGGDGWVTIEFDKLFIYDGESNVALVVDDNTGSWVSSPQFYVFDAPSQAIRIYSDGTDYDPYEPESYTGTVLNVKNRVRFGIETGTCFKPSGFTVSEVTGHTATLEWAKGSDETAWQIAYSTEYFDADDEDVTIVNVNTRPFVLNQLLARTGYFARIRSVCGNDYSNWTEYIYFETDPSCLPPTNPQFTEITSTGAYLTWEPSSDEFLWEIKWMSEYDEDWMEDAAMFDPEFQIYNCQPYTTYYVLIRANCDAQLYDYSDYILTSFTTAASMPYEEDFDEIELPLGFNSYFGGMDAEDGLNNGAHWKVGRHQIWDTKSHPYLQVGGTNTRDWLVTPLIDVNTFTADLSFKLALTAYSYNYQILPADESGDDDVFAVMVTADYGETWEPVRIWDNAGADDVYNEIATEGETINIDLSDYVGQVIRIAFYGESTEINAENFVHVDSIYFNGISFVEQPMSMNTGWNWFSSYVSYNEETLDFLANVLEEVPGNPFLKSQTAYLQLMDTVWEGTESFTTLENEQMYMLMVNEPVEFSFVGDLVDVEETEITLNPGWTWIGELLMEETPLDVAFAGITPSVGDYVKGQAAFCTYTEEGWDGTLETLEPGQGYMYMNKSDEPLTLVYTLLGEPELRGFEKTEHETYWSVNYHRYRTNASMIVTLDPAMFEMREGNYEIAAFVNGETRGAARLQRVAGKYMAFLTVNGNDGDNVSFRLFDVDRNQENDNYADEHVVYMSDALVGSVESPMVLHFRDNGIADDDNLVQLFPNPAKEKVTVNGYAIETVKVYNAMGQLLISEEYGDATHVELNLEALSAGVYTVSVRSNGQIINKMIVKE